MDRSKLTIRGYGKLQETTDGKVICHICNQSFQNLGRHVGHAHNLTAKQYREEFGLSNSQPLCSKEVSAKRREAVNKHPELIESLRNNSKATQFQKNDGFTDKRRLQAQYSQQNKEYSVEATQAMINNGKRLGKSKTGYKARQKKREK